jgi:hypothetical protein
MEAGEVSARSVSEAADELLSLRRLQFFFS